MAAKSTHIDMEQNYVTITLYMAGQYAWLHMVGTTQLSRRLHLVGPYTEINEFYELLLIFENLIKFAGFNKL